MSVDRSMRNVFAAFLLIAALFVAMNWVVTSAPFTDWWLPLVLLIVGAALALVPHFEFTHPEEPEPVPEPEHPALSLSEPETRTYHVVPQPRLHTMTIRPDPDTEQYTITIPEDDVLPFIEGSPEAASTEVVAEGPSQQLPVDRTPDVGEAAPDLKFTARTEYAEPESAVAAKEPPAAPPPADGVTEPQRTEPAKEVIAGQTAAPEQPYEAEKIGAITPERAERVVTDSASPQEMPAVTEPAAPRVADGLSGAGTVGAADDLTKLNGIGAKSAAALKAAGIDSYQKLANSSDDQIRAALSSGGVRLVGDVTTWTHQAGYAARGDWESLQRFNAERKSASGD